VQLYVVLNTHGNGTLVGVYDNRALAEAIVALDRHYLKIHTCQLNTTSTVELPAPAGGPATRRPRR
jgi:hypothetical protein